MAMEAKYEKQLNTKAARNLSPNSVDLNIIVDGDQFGAHWKILKENSVLFEEICHRRKKSRQKRATQGTAESEVDSVHLKGITAELFDKFLDYVYTKRKKANEQRQFLLQEIRDVVKFSVMFQLRDLVNLMSDQCLRDLDVNVAKSSLSTMNELHRALLRFLYDGTTIYRTKDIAKFVAHEAYRDGSLECLFSVLKIVSDRRRKRVEMKLKLLDVAIALFSTSLEVSGRHKMAVDDGRCVLGAESGGPCEPRIAGAGKRSRRRNGPQGHLVPRFQPLRPRQPEDGAHAASPSQQNPSSKKMHDLNRRTADIPNTGCQSNSDLNAKIMTKGKQKNPQNRATKINKEKHIKKPKLVTKDASSKEDQHVACDQEHAVSNQEHVVRGKKHAVCNQEHAVRNQEHAVCNQEHAVRNQEHAVRNQEHAVRNQEHVGKKHAVCNQEHAVRNQEHAVCNQEHAVRNQEHAVRNQEHAVRNQEHVGKKHAVCNQEHAVRNQEHTVRNQQHAVRNQEHAVFGKKHAACGMQDVATANNAKQDQKTRPEPTTTPAREPRKKTFIEQETTIIRRNVRKLWTKEQSAPTIIWLRPDEQERNHVGLGPGELERLSKTECETPVGKNPNEETPKGETSEREYAAGETSEGETSAGETAVGETAEGETAVEETPKGNTSGGENPSLGKTQERLFLTGGIQKNDYFARRVVLEYDLINGVYTNHSAMKTSRYNHGIAQLGRYVYFVGGNSGFFEQLRSVESYSIERAKWSTNTSMCEARDEFALVECGGFLYAIGGHNGVHDLRSVEKFSAGEDSWSFVSPMGDYRAGACAVAVENRYIYVTGGFNGQVYLNTVEHYDITTDSWTAVEPMKYKRAYSCLVSVAHNIYVIGGFNGQNAQSACEVYDTTTNTWSALPEVNTPRMNATAIVSRQLVFVFGGECESVFLETVECYDVDNQTWSFVQRLPQPMAGLRACVYVEEMQPENKGTRLQF